MTWAYKKHRMDGFSAGVIASLVVIRGFQEFTIYDYVVDSCGDDELVKFARRNKDSELPHIRASILRLRASSSLVSRDAK